MYPLDDPPPYPGEPPYTAEEKQPLNPSDLVVLTEGPDDTPVTVAVGRGAGDAFFMHDLSARGQGCIPHSLSGVSPFDDSDPEPRPPLASVAATPRYVTTPPDSHYQDDRSTCSSQGYVPPSQGNGRYALCDSSSNKVKNAANNNMPRQRHIGSQSAGYSGGVSGGHSGSGSGVGSGGSDVSSPETIVGCHGNTHHINYSDVIDGASSSGLSNQGCINQGQGHLPPCHPLPVANNASSLNTPSSPVTLTPQG